MLLFVFSFCRNTQRIISQHLSHKLFVARSQHKTKETVLHVCLQFPTHHPLPSWFSLWIKPDQTLTNDIRKKKKNKKSKGNTLLVPVPCSYCNNVPIFFVRIGLECYGLLQNSAPSSIFLWRKGPNMTVARERAVAGIVDGKIYVMGGCNADESKNWAEIRNSSIKTLEVLHRKLYVRTHEKKDYVYDPRTSKWGDVKKPHVKVLVQWETLNLMGRQYKYIWCAVITIGKRNGDEVWGMIEWASILLKVPSSYVFLRRLATSL
ncbi:hypothetical protein EUTSA_v10023938mg [Eutrema salsugineum]|uniref:FKB95-like N-terminal Kelch domain-containing protein n=1 Tax=Eutrema salsugineum TaxID=72664 RepID=V4JVZ1_EUTSA|nr:hypothetical protein EUTSA_v10023938mg [Eutrema salsugineum]